MNLALQYVLLPPPGARMHTRTTLAPVVELVLVLAEAAQTVKHAHTLKSNFKGRLKTIKGICLKAFVQRFLKDLSNPSNAF